MICSGFFFGGGGRLAAVTFLCKTWENSIVFFESLNISESSLQNIKKKQLDEKTSLYTFLLYLVYVELSVIMCDVLFIYLFTKLCRIRQANPTELHSIMGRPYV